MPDPRRAAAASSVAAFLVAAGVPSQATARESSSAPPNVLLIVSEDNGPELGCYGDRHARTPNLDRLAATGVRFERAWVPYSVCSPSRACFLTGLYPQQNGQLGLATHKFAMYRHWPSIPSLLKAAGYRTGLIGKLHVNPAAAFPFDFRAIRGANFSKRDVASYARAAAEFFAARGERPFFLSINYPDAHYPLHRQQFGRPAQPLEAGDVEPLGWVGADSPRLRELTANYYNCLARLDDGVGLLLDELAAAGNADDTLVIYIGDHGAQFSRGKGSCYEAGLRIPMIVRWPGRAKRGHVASQLVTSLDILPTVLAAAGLEVPAELPGRRLQPLLRGGDPPAWRRYLFAFSSGAAPAIAYPQLAVRDARYKLIWSPFRDLPNLLAQAYLTHYNSHFIGGTSAAEIAAASPRVQRAYARFAVPPRYELYDLERDPFELDDLAGDADHGAVRERLVAALRDWQERIADPFLDPGNRADWARDIAAARDGGYREDGSFRWPYLERFPAWQRRTRDR